MIYIEKNYDDIINLPHHISSVHPQMSVHDRAAQFAPFAALSGHSDAIDATAKEAVYRVENEVEKIDESSML